MKKLMLVWMVLGLLMLTACTSYDKYGYMPDAYYENIDKDQETYAEIVENPYIRTSDLAVSTFSTDVDTASYTNVRRMLNEGRLPNKDAVRIEEMINYFNYDLAAPEDGDAIHVITELSKAPWNAEHQLFMVGLKAKEVVFEETEGMNLVFLVDVSGSMGSADKLPLLKEALYILIDQLREDDRISIVTYASGVSVLLDGGEGGNTREIKNAIRKLTAGGSTSGSGGIQKAYQIAEKHFIEGGNNRIILASDGDFNVGISNVDDLKEFIEDKRQTGVFLSVLGFGTGNLRDDVMETLANHGNGVYFYIDSLKEAEKVFIHQLGASMVTVAKDVKLQIEFNPAHVYAYRLLGYENRVLQYDDFENDVKDAGDMGSGNTVIAFYEIIPATSDEEVNQITFPAVEELRYTGENYLDEFSIISVRYKEPHEEVSRLIETKTYVSDFTLTPSLNFRFASSVVEFGLLLRDSSYKGNASYDQVISRAMIAVGTDPYGYRSEFIELVRLAQDYSLED